MKIILSVPQILTNDWPHFEPQLHKMSVPGQRAGAGGSGTGNLGGYGGDINPVDRFEASQLRRGLANPEIAQQMDDRISQFHQQYQAFLESVTDAQRTESDNLAEQQWQQHVQAEVDNNFPPGPSGRPSTLERATVDTFRERTWELYLQYGWQTEDVLDEQQQYALQALQEWQGPHNNAFMTRNDPIMTKYALIIVHTLRAGADLGLRASQPAQPVAPAELPQPPAGT